MKKPKRRAKAAPPPDPDGDSWELESHMADGARAVAKKLKPEDRKQMMEKARSGKVDVLAEAMQRAMKGGAHGRKIKGG